jgi:hypothetical protein
LDLLDLKEKPDLLVLLDLKVKQGPLEKQGPSDPLDPKAKQDPLEKQGPLERPDLKGRLELLVLLALQEPEYKLLDLLKM